MSAHGGVVSARGGGGRVCSGVYPSMHWGKHPPPHCEQNDTGVKTLPCRNYVAYGKHDFFNETAVIVTYTTNYKQSNPHFPVKSVQ